MWEWKSWIVLFIVLIFLWTVPSDAPENLTISQVTNSSLVLGWDHKRSYFNSTAVVGFVLKVKDSYVLIKNLTVPALPEEKHISGLNNGTRYCMTVTAILEQGGTGLESGDICESTHGQDGKDSRPGWTGLALDNIGRSRTERKSCFPMSLTSSSSSRDRNKYCGIWRRSINLFKEWSLCYCDAIYRRLLRIFAAWTIFRIFISVTRGRRWRQRHRKTRFSYVLLHLMLSNANRLTGTVFRIPRSPFCCERIFSLELHIPLLIHDHQEPIFYLVLCNQLEVPISAVYVLYDLEAWI